MKTYSKEVEALLTLMKYQIIDYAPQANSDNLEELLRDGNEIEDILHHCTYTKTDVPTDFPKVVSKGLCPLDKDMQYVVVSVGASYLKLLGTCYTGEEPCWGTIIVVMPYEFKETRYK